MGQAPGTSPCRAFIRTDLSGLDALRRAGRGHDVVMHLAAGMDARTGRGNPRIDLENCTIVTLDTLEAMLVNGVQGTVPASGSAVFGETSIRPAPESKGPLLPLSLLGAGRLAGEWPIRAYCRLNNMQARMLRFSSVFRGPRWPWGHLRFHPLRRRVTVAGQVMCPTYGLTHAGRENWAGPQSTPPKR